MPHRALQMKLALTDDNVLKDAGQDQTALSDLCSNHVITTLSRLDRFLTTFGGRLLTLGRQLSGLLVPKHLVLLLKAW